MPPIVLTTDFGLSDAFVGVMKGVILNINPQAAIIDLTHDIQPQDVGQASFVLGVNCPYFPPDTIHVAVVDPGVGTERRAVLLVTPTAKFLAPDNGLLSHVLKDYLAASPDRSALESAARPGHIPLPPGLTAYALTNPRYRLNPVSNTFHGRDVFAPAAAHLSRGMAPPRLGEPVTDLLWQPSPEPTRQGNELVGEVIYADRFGNLITNIPAAELPAGDSNAAPVMVAIGPRRISRLSRTFHDADADADSLIALIGSNGYLEIAVPDGNAAQVLGLGVGAPVRVQGGSTSSP